MNRFAGFVLMALFFGFSAPVVADITPVERTIIIGIAVVESGAPLREVENAARMAASEINAGGGFSLPNSALVGSHIFPSVSADGFGIRLVTHTVAIETIKLSPAVRADPAGDRKRLEEFIRERGPTALIAGALSNEQSLMAAAISAEWEVPLLLTAIIDSELEERLHGGPNGGRMVFHLAPRTDYLAGFLSAAVAGPDGGRAKRLYLLTEPSPWAREVTEGIIQRSGSLPGLEVAGHGEFPADGADLNGIDLLLIIGTAGQPEESGRMLVTLGNLPSSGYPPSTKFHGDYRSSHGESIRSPHAPAAFYDGVHLLKEALVLANSTATDAVTAALEGAARNGAMGRLLFDGRHRLKFGLDPAKAAVSLLVAGSPAGRPRIVYPPNLTD